MRQIFEISLLCWIKNFLIRNWMLVCDILYSNSNYSNNSNTLSCSSVSIHIKSTSSMYLKYIKEILQRVFIVRTFQKLTHLGGGGTKCFAWKGVINLKRGVAVEVGGHCHFFYYFAVQSHLLCVGKVRFPLLLFEYFELAMQDSHPIHYCTKTWYHLYISDPFW